MLHTHGYAQYTMRTVKLCAGAAVIAAGLGMAAPTTMAQEQSYLGIHDNWVAREDQTSKGKICYIVSQPQDSSPKNVRRDDIFFMVTHRPTDNITNEVTTVIGYPFKKGSDVVVEIGGSKFEMFTNGDSAWVELPANESKLVSAMRAGSTMVVRGTSWRGTQTVDQYSLKGVTAALDQIEQACK